ncbi:MAG TPA: hypothetical protein VGC51_03250 [Hansschlegelia sp.]
MAADFIELIDLWKRQAALAGGFAAMAPFAGFVMANRLTRMTSEFGRPTAAGAREAERMVAEKMSAAFESGAAASKVLGGLPHAGSPMAVAGLMVAAGEAALRPVARTVRANARRLSRQG